MQALLFTSRKLFLRSRTGGCRPAGAGLGVARCRQATGFATLQGMHPLTLLEPLSLLQHAPADGFHDRPDALVYIGAQAAVRFDKATGQVTLTPVSADLLQLHRELQTLAQTQEARERTRILSKLAQRPY